MKSILEQREWRASAAISASSNQSMSWWSAQHRRGSSPGEPDPAGHSHQWV